MRYVIPFLVLLLSAPASRSEPLRLLFVVQAAELRYAERARGDLGRSLTARFEKSDLFRVMPCSTDVDSIRTAINQGRLAEEEVQQINDTEAFMRLIAAVGETGGVFIYVEQLQTVDDVDLGLDAKATLVSAGKMEEFGVSARASKFEAKYAEEGKRRTVYDVAAEKIVSEMSSRLSFFDLRPRAPQEPLATHAPVSAPTSAPTVSIPDLVQSNDPDAALQTLARLSAAAPRNPAYYVAAGDIYLKKGKPDYAILEYKRAVYVDPANREAYGKLLRVYQEKAQAAKVLETADKMIAIGFDGADVRYAMAQAHLLLKASYESNRRPDASEAELKKAFGQFAKATELDRNNADLHIAYGKQLLLANRFEEAVAVYKRASELAPQMPEIWQSLSLSFLGNEEYREAFDSLERSLLLRQVRPYGLDADTYTKALKLMDGRAREIYLDARSNIAAYAERRIPIEHLLLRSQKLYDCASRLRTTMNNIDPPVAKQKTHLQRVLSYQVLTQSMLALISFIETNDATLQERATAMLTEFATQYESIRAKPAAVSREGKVREGVETLPARGERGG